MDIHIFDALVTGNDVLVVKGAVGGIYALDEQQLPAVGDDGWPTARVLEARGWVSALTNHYDEKHYAKDGNLVEDAEPRAMTPEEQLEYCKRLIAEQYWQLAAETPTARYNGVKPRSLGISG